MELVTEEQWKARGQYGLPALARELCFLGYLENKKCLVDSIRLDRKKEGGVKEGTDSYMAYLQGGLHFKWVSNESNS
jgi:hypothetical protein